MSMEESSCAIADESAVPTISLVVREGDEDKDQENHEQRLILCQNDHPSTFKRCSAHLQNTFSCSCADKEKQQRPLSGDFLTSRFNLHIKEEFACNKGHSGPLQLGVCTPTTITPTSKTGALDASSLSMDFCSICAIVAMPALETYFTVVDMPVRPNYFGDRCQGVLLCYADLIGNILASWSLTSAQYACNFVEWPPPMVSPCKLTLLFNSESVANAKSKTYDIHSVSGYFRALLCVHRTHVPMPYWDRYTDWNSIVTAKEEDRAPQHGSIPIAHQIAITTYNVLCNISYGVANSIFVVIQRCSEFGTLAWENFLVVQWAAKLINKFFSAGALVTHPILFSRRKPNKLLWSSKLLGRFNCLLVVWDSDKFTQPTSSMWQCLLSAYQEMHLLECIDDRLTLLVDSLVQTMHYNGEQGNATMKQALCFAPSSSSVQLADNFTDFQGLLVLHAMQPIHLGDSSWVYVAGVISLANLAPAVRYIACFDPGIVSLRLAVSQLFLGICLASVRFTSGSVSMGKDDSTTSILCCMLFIGVVIPKYRAVGVQFIVCFDPGIVFTTIFPLRWILRNYTESYPGVVTMVQRLVACSEIHHFHQLKCNAVQNIFHNSYVRQQNMLTGRPLADCAVLIIESISSMALLACPARVMKLAPSFSLEYEIIEMEYDMVYLALLFAWGCELLADICPTVSTTILQWVQSQCLCRASIIRLSICVWIILLDADLLQYWYTNIFVGPSQSALYLDMLVPYGRMPCSTSMLRAMQMGPQLLKASHTGDYFQFLTLIHFTCYEFDIRWHIAWQKTSIRGNYSSFQILWPSLYQSRVVLPFFNCFCSCCDLLLGIGTGIVALLVCLHVLYAIHNLCLGSLISYSPAREIHKEQTLFSSFYSALPTIAADITCSLRKMVSNSSAVLLIISRGSVIWHMIPKASYLLNYGASCLVVSLISLRPV